MAGAYKMTDKEGIERVIDWDVYLQIYTNYEGWIDPIGLPILHSSRQDLAHDNYFSLVDRGFLE